MNQMNQTHSKKYTLFLKSILLVLSIVLLSGCKKAAEHTDSISFTAEVISLSEDTLLVRPEDNTKEDELCSQIYVPTDTKITDANGKESDFSALSNAKRVEVVYDGVLDNSDPALITNCYQILILE